MKKIVYREFGSPSEVLRVEESPDVPLQEGEVRVKVLATPIHPADLLQVAGNYGIRPALPATPGSEGVGRVVESAAPGLSVGQTVLLSAGGGSWRDHLIGPAGAFVPLPEGIDPQQLAMLTVNPLTAHLMLSLFGDLQPGDWVLQSAASSTVGGYVVQLAKHRGLKTVNVVRRESAVAALREAGADVVVVDGPDLATRIAEAVGDGPVRLALDAVGGTTFGRLADALSPGATIVSYGVLSGEGGSFSAGALVFNDVRARGFWLSKWFQEASPTDVQAAFGELVPLIAQGVLRGRVAGTYALDEIDKAVIHAAQDSKDGKILLVPGAGA
ncbi:MAG: zinc-dependent alcohol dehydrogenase family protein [Myxococcota bacterium]